MKLYSKKNKENLFDEFSIHLSFPIIKWGIQEGDAWGNDYATKCVDINFNTNFVYRNDNKTHWHFQLTLLGFGFTITRQTGY
jgi:hypothetical protein